MHITKLADWKWYEHIMETWPIRFIVPYSIVVLVNT